ncbi:LegC family aminotransferase [Adhaeribacter swui]|uniref:LegC family aminotransferase n=1 Tax=Adhaeribacter swui TaxID=2086471 RepID=A0A7G7G9H0_9BACT|nr:LegC family aminotransferase [Adhaeribacter swui]QNF33804.1 LegC family aminotransferase [Adhaeribacter swui]
MSLTSQPITEHAVSSAIVALCQFIKELFPGQEFIPLHEPRFVGNERKYVLDAIDSTYVSSVGKYVDQFEAMIRDYTGARYAVATVNGTAALHMALLLAGVNRNELVITQPFSFIATCNAISYVGASPLFVDINKSTLGLSADVLSDFLKNQTEFRAGNTYHRETGKRIAACVPMHTFGHPAEIEQIINSCREYAIPVIEDAAESLGSTFGGKQTGTFGLLGTYSFNGNKTITSGGGGMIVTDDEKLGKMAKHLTTQAKVPHRWDFVHDHIGFNYRLPNLNAAMACAQLEQLNQFISNKRELTQQYKKYFERETAFKLIQEPAGARSNYWLNAVLCPNRSHRDALLAYSNDHGVMTRPAWQLMHRLDMFKDCPRTDLPVAEWIEERLVNIPSSVRVNG